MVDRAYRLGWVGGFLVGRSRMAGFAFLVPRTVKKVRWRVGVEGMPGAFVEDVETPVPPPEGAAPKQ